MALYSALTPVIEAHQWSRNGDHPEDRTINRINTGRIVQRHPFYRPHVDHNAECDLCRKPLGDHGVMNPVIYLELLGEGNVVCPGDYIITHRDSKNGRVRGYTVYKQELFNHFYGPYEEPTV